MDPTGILRIMAGAGFPPRPRIILFRLGRALSCSASAAHYPGLPFWEKADILTLYAA